MKWIVRGMLLAFLLSCSEDTSTGPGFTSDSLVVDPRVEVRTFLLSGSPFGEVGFTGTVHNRSRESLTGLRVVVEMFDVAGNLLSTDQADCDPTAVGSGATAAFVVSVLVADPATIGRYRITPHSDQGTGTAHSGTLS